MSGSITHKFLRPFAQSPVAHTESVNRSGSREATYEAGPKRQSIRDIWSADDHGRLMKLMEARQTLREACEHFPGRSLASMQLHWYVNAKTSRQWLSPTKPYKRDTPDEVDQIVHRHMNGEGWSEIAHDMC